MSVLQKLTEGIVNRDLQKEGSALMGKWEKTGLLEGINADHSRQTMARLLENQARELLREASTMAQGDVEGFASVAFPIVRRVFGGLIANDLVSVQPMSLPSGLIFFLDFQHTHARLGINEDGIHSPASNDSLYGGGKVGQGIKDGVVLTGLDSDKGFYNLSNGYSSPTGSATVTVTIRATGTVGDPTSWGPGGRSDVAANSYSAMGDKLVRFDPDLSGSAVAVGTLLLSALVDSNSTPINRDNLISMNLLKSKGHTGSSHLVRRLSVLDPVQATGSSDVTRVLVVLAPTGSETTANLRGALEGFSRAEFPIIDDFTGTPAAGATNALGAVVGEDSWGLENTEAIPEIDIKVDSISVTAITKKLKAKWTPELGQDLNAYHNLDAEVELTSILSEQIALEIDREIIEDLVKGAKAATYYWSRKPGKFVNKETGLSVNGTLFPDFTGTVSEWYETLVETINDCSAQIHRKTLRGGANFLVCGPEVANILEFTSGFRANIAADEAKGTVGAVKAGSMSKKWDVWVDPYFPRNVVLVGRKGNSFLESGYVYAPYVPLQVTPTIFGTEDFVPRKGVMTRYAKKMVRPDMYGLVVVSDLIG